MTSTMANDARCCATSTGCSDCRSSCRPRRKLRFPMALPSSSSAGLRLAGARDFAASDALRDELAAIGVEVRDTANGQETTVRR